MFGHRPRLLVDVYFPTLRNAEVPKRGTSAKHVDEYVATVWDQLLTALQDAKAQSMAEVQRQKWYYGLKIGAIGLKPGNLVLVKADTFQGRRKVKDRWEDKPYKVVHLIMADIPLYEVKDQHGHSCNLHQNWLLLMASEAGVPICVGVCQVWDRCTSPIPANPTPRGSDSKTTPQEDDGLWTHCIRPGRLPWGGSVESYSFSHGYQPEHPLRWRFQVMCSGSGGLHWQNGWWDHMCLVERKMSQHINAIR